MWRLAPVLRDTLGQGGSALSLLEPESNLSASIVDPIVSAIEQAGGRIRCGVRVSGVEPTASGYQLLIHDASTEVFDQVVLALPPWALSRLSLPPSLNATAWAQAFGSQPIATIYLGFESSFRLPAPLIQLAGPTPEDARVWALDRAHCGEAGVVAISLSAEGPWHAISGDALTQACLSALQEAVINLPPCLWQKAVTVQRATYTATPAALIAESDLTPLPGLYLAGDWSHPAYPATLEAAVSSGFAAAQRIMQAET
jgi:predicted NAD/FAD-dependent oxidoreductase